ncbi:MAG: hypothetical protein ACM3N4_09100 [Nitrososphaerota archaeon]
MRYVVQSTRGRWLLSILGFGALAAVLAPLYVITEALLTGSELYAGPTPASMGPYVGIVALLAPPALIGGLVSWWGVVAAPRRVSAVRGGCAGLLAVALTLLALCVINSGGIWTIATTSQALPWWQLPLEVLNFWLVGLLYIIAIPFGWGVLALGGAVGASYGILARRLARGGEGGPAAAAVGGS